MSPEPPRPQQRWEDVLVDLFEDLEQQAEGLALAERDLERAELGRAEYAQVALAARLHASVGLTVTLGVRGFGPVTGELPRVGANWCLVAAAQDWIVRMDAVLRARGLSERGVAREQRPLSARLGLGSALRGVAAARGPVVIHLEEGTLLRGWIGRVGADFLELWVSEGVYSPDLPAPWTAGRPGHVELVPFDALAAVRRT